MTFRLLPVFPVPRGVRVRITGATLFYLVTACLTIWATSNGRDHAAIWPADAILLGLLLELERKYWTLPLLLGVLANHLANDIMRGFQFSHLLYGVINMTQVWLAAAMLTRGRPIGTLLGDPATLGRFVVWAGIIAPAMGALLGSLTSAWIYQQDFQASYVRWFTSNSLGLLVFTPLIKALFDGGFRECIGGKTRAQILVMVGLQLTFATLTTAVFMQRSLPLLFLPVSALVLLTFKLGRFGVKMAAVVAAVIGTVATIQNIGPVALITGNTFAKSAFFQFYLVVLQMTAMVVFSIVSSRARAMEQLADRENFLQRMLVNSPDVVLSLDRNGHCTFCAGPTEAFFGMASADMIGLTLTDLGTRIAAEVAHLDPAHTDSGKINGAVDFEPRFHPHLTIEATIAPNLHEGVHTGSVVTFRDISTRKRRERDLKQMALVDDLTKVWNRSGFYRLLDEAMEKGDVISLALIDVDWFKSINDTFGHASGDRALTTVAEIMKSQTRSSDAVGRLGGDEFAILFSAPPEVAAAACRRIAQGIQEARVNSYDGRPMQLSISCGVAGMHPGWKRQQLFDAADMAVYEMKARGRNGVQLAA